MNLRVCNVINPPADARHKQVDTVREAYDYINKEADRQLNLAWIHTNCFWLEAFNEADQEWEEWQDEGGSNLDEYAQLQGW